MPTTADRTVYHATSTDRLIYRLLARGWTPDEVANLLHNLPNQETLKMRIACADLRLTLERSDRTQDADLLEAAESLHRMNQMLELQMPSIEASLHKIDNLTAI